MVICSSVDRKSTYARVVELVDSLDSGSSVHCGRAGSSPASRTKEETRYSLRIPGFCCFVAVYLELNIGKMGNVEKLFPLCFPLCVYSLDKLLHSAGAIMLHLLCYMAVNI